MKRALSAQLTLLDWAPPAPVRRFAEERVRAQTFCERMARAISATLRDADGDGHPREEIARRMSAYLGERVSLNVLNAYASQARVQAIINLPRFVALLHATGDQRLLELLAEPFGWAVVERRYLPLIELAAVQERQNDLERQKKVLRRRARAEGAL